MSTSILDDDFASHLTPMPSLPVQPPPQQSPQLTAALQPAPPVTAEHRAFGDAPVMRKLIYDNVLKAAQGFEPLTNTQHTLSLHDVDYTDPGEFTKAQEKKAILSWQSLGRKLQGTWRLTDNATGNVIANRRTTLATVPHLNDLGTYIRGGNSYSMAHQARLLPGAFARIKNNGELESHVNVLPGKGLTHRVFLDPESGVFHLQMAQANIPIVPILRAMGVKDSQLREAWGNDLTAANLAKDDPQAINKAYAKLVRNGDPQTDPMTKRQAVAEAFAKMELDPEVTARTLDKGYTHLTPDAYLAITKKLLGVARGEQEPDDRDAMANQQVLGPEDLFAERLRHARNGSRSLLWKASNRGSLDHVPTGFFDQHINAALMSSGLGAPLEEVNPAEIFDQQARITRMGEGGIASTDAVPDESKSVTPSQFGFVDFLRTPESSKAGVDMRLARAARKGADGRLYTPVIDHKSGQTVYKSPQDLSAAALAFPGEMAKNTPMVAALSKGKVRMVPRASVQFSVPHMEHTFSPLGNMIPMKSMIKGQRAVMAARMTTQALPLVDSEAPLVQSGMPEKPDRSYEEEYGKHMGAVHAEGPGKVLNVTPDSIDLQLEDGTKKSIELYNNRPFNRKTLLHQTPVVKPGDTFQPGQLLAHSNYTDKNGVTGLGKNLRVAYMAFNGHNFEDANVISQSAANRLTSEHMYSNDHEWDPKSTPSLKRFVSLFPAVLDRQAMEKFDERGAIKPGTIVHPGDPLVLIAHERERALNQVHRGRSPSYANQTVTWDHHSPGVVTDVDHTNKGVSVIVKATAAMQVGDKLSGRYGDKGVVSRIVPDDEMPTDAQGRPFEVLANPLGIISRSNPAQILEAALGKIAERTGKPYKVADFGNEDDMSEFGRRELAKYGIPDTEDVIDPTTGRKIPGVFTGNRYFMKLHHTSESKAQGRGLGAYTAEGTPAKGGVEGAKRIGMLELHALLSHGASDVLRDAHLIRGQSSPQYWSQFMSGFKPPVPNVPQVYEKFVHQLKGAGINVVRQGDKTHIMALRDADIHELAGGRELQNTDTVDWREGLREMPGGLFDKSLTGGHGGNRWSQITLQEPMPNPVFEEPIRRTLGLTGPKFEDILAGKEQLNGETGPAAIHTALKAINLDAEIERARAEIGSNKKTARDAAVRRLGYLKDSQRMGIHPAEWMWTRVPVLPPAFRPVTTMGAKKLPLVADPNYLYKELFDANQNLKQMHGQVDDLGDERMALYNSLKGVVGLGDPIHPKNQERQVKGILRHVFGSNAKYGVVQRKLLGSTVDLVGRSVVTPDPELDMDHVGVPEDKAWDIYKPFVVRNLVRAGMPRMQAARAVEERSENARASLVKEMESRPILVNRAPTLHRFGLMAAWPKLVKGDTLRVSPLTVGGFGMDFDGDAVQYHVPSTDEAAQEAAEKMLPSRNLFSVATLKQAQHKPSQEYVGGLYEASAQIDQKNQPMVFATAADATRAYYQGRIGIGRRVQILG